MARLGISYQQAQGHAYYSPHATPPGQAIDTLLILLSVSIFNDWLLQLHVYELPSFAAGFAGDVAELV